MPSTMKVNTSILILGNETRRNPQEYFARVLNVCHDLFREFKCVFYPAYLSCSMTASWEYSPLAITLSIRRSTFLLFRIHARCSPSMLTVQLTQILLFGRFALNRSICPGVVPAALIVPFFHLSVIPCVSYILLIARLRHGLIMRSVF